LVADGLVLACATTAEERAARRAGLRTALVGLRGVNGVPPAGEIVSYGLAGALDGLAVGAVVDAVRVVDETGAVLWEGEPLGVPGAVRGTILASERIVDDPAERRELHERTGADAVDLESGVLARSGRLRGVVRAVSDTPERRLHGICDAVKPEGPYDWAGIARGLARSPLGFVRAGLDGKRALDSLAAATSRWTRA
jgi:nucleoside phosphorylase